MIQNSTYELEEVTLIAGTYTSIEFSVFDETDNTLAEISEYDVSCLVSYLSQPNEVILEKVGAKTSQGKYIITFDSLDTIDLNGRYTYQPLLSVVVLGEIRQYRPAQGILNIISAIK